MDYFMFSNKKFDTKAKTEMLTVRKLRKVTRNDLYFNKIRNQVPKLIKI